VYGRSRSKRKHTAKARFAEEDLLGVGLASVANPTSEVVLPFQISAE